jgi:solute carrier family 35 protein F1/2
MHVPIFLTKYQEFVVKKSNRLELMAMLGLFGAIVSAIQMYPWELIH